jgi:uncharacterized protein (DUF433 family)
METKQHIDDLRNVGNYPISESAHYLMIPIGTLRSWVLGQSRNNSQGFKRSKPLIELPESGMKIHLLSFTNLVEAHILRAIRAQHGVSLDKVRKALDFMQQQFSVPHPLARVEFQTDGVNLFVESVGRLINASDASPGQLAMREMLKHLLKRIELDEEGIAARLFPYTRSSNEDGPKLVVIDPRISFGRPILVGTGIPTAILAERYKAGDSIDELAYDYDCDRLKIEEAIRYEFPRAA